MRFRAAKIRITVTRWQGDHEDRYMPGRVLGDWAYHRPHDSDRGWTVTHLPTGRAAGYLNSERQARTVAKAAHEITTRDGLEGATPNQMRECRDLRYLFETKAPDAIESRAENALALAAAVRERADEFEEATA